MNCLQGDKVFHGGHVRPEDHPKGGQEGKGTGSHQEGVQVSWNSVRTVGKAARGIRTTVSGWPALFRYWPHIERFPTRNNGLEGLD